MLGSLQLQQEIIQQVLYMIQRTLAVCPIEEILYFINLMLTKHVQRKNRKTTDHAPVVFSVSSE
ncbi:hypothetical protein PMEGAS228_33350 [Priestia megaterium]